MHSKANDNFLLETSFFLNSCINFEIYSKRQLLDWLFLVDLEVLMTFLAERGFDSELNWSQAWSFDISLKSIAI